MKLLTVYMYLTHLAYEACTLPPHQTNIHCTGIFVLDIPPACSHFCKNMLLWLQLLSLSAGHNHTSALLDNHSHLYEEGACVYINQLAHMNSKFCYLPLVHSGGGPFQYSTLPLLRHLILLLPHSLYPYLQAY